MSVPYPVTPETANSPYPEKPNPEREGSPPHSPDQTNAPSPNSAEHGGSGPHYDYDPYPHQRGSTTPPDPSVAEIEQIDLPVVPVRIEGPITTRMAPAVRADMRSIPIGTTTDLLFGKDPRRQRLVLIAVGDSFSLGTDKATAQSAFGFVLPQNASVEIRHRDNIYARGINQGGTISFVREDWAD